MAARISYVKSSARSRDGRIVILDENFLELLSSFGKLQLACTPRVFENKHQEINSPRILPRILLLKWVYTIQNVCTALFPLTQIYADLRKKAWPKSGANVRQLSKVSLYKKRT